MEVIKASPTVSFTGRTATIDDTFRSTEQLLAIDGR